MQDPTFGVRVLNLPSRIQTVSLTMTTTGAVMMALAWLDARPVRIGAIVRFQCTAAAVLRPARPHAAALDAATAGRPPMYSKDVYSHLAQSQIARNGLDPYRVGPATGLGLDHVFTGCPACGARPRPRSAVPVDRPVDLGAHRGEHRRGGAQPSAGGARRRQPDCLGHARLARRCGVAEVSALWLGAANPLLLMHLVAGIHNEALMLGLMLTGTEFALRGIDSDSPLIPRPLRGGRH